MISKKWANQCQTYKGLLNLYTDYSAIKPQQIINKKFRYFNTA